VPKDKLKEETKKTEIAVAQKKAPVIRKPKERTVIASAAPRNVLSAFDDVFERFRNDFADMLFPSYWESALALSPEIRSPAVDLEDNEKEYVVKAEMPGFKKEDIEIEARDNFVEITGKAGWKYDKKEQAYICKERACESFYRRIELPEDVLTDDVTACLSDGVLEIALPKKTPKPKRKIQIK
jgi:HSP20 family protein